MSPCLLESGLWILLWGLESGVFITSSPLLSFVYARNSFNRRCTLWGDVRRSSSSNLSRAVECPQTKPPNISMSCQRISERAAENHGEMQAAFGSLLSAAVSRGSLKKSCDAMVQPGCCFWRRLCFHLTESTFQISETRSSSQFCNVFSPSIFSDQFPSGLALSCIASQFVGRGT